MRVLQRRPSNPLDRWERATYLRALTLTGGTALVEVRNRGSIDAPDVRLRVLGGGVSGPMRLEAARTVRRMLGLDLDPEPLQTLRAVNGTLSATVRALRGMRPPRFADLFEAFANVVPFQQLSLDAGVAIVARLVHRFGAHVEHGGRRCRAFPTAATVGQARVPSLRACGLSTRKAQGLRAIARAIADGELSEARLSAMATPDALAALSGLPGIGPWSAGLVMLRGLGRTDVFPPGDVGALRGLRELLHAGPRARLERVVERCGDRRGYLYFCILGRYLLERGLIHAAR